MSQEPVTGCCIPLNGRAGSTQKSAVFGFMVYRGPARQFWCLTWSSRSNNFVTRHNRPRAPTFIIIAISVTIRMKQHLSCDGWSISYVDRLMQFQNTFINYTKRIMSRALSIFLGHLKKSWKVLVWSTWSLTLLTKAILETSYSRPYIILEPSQDLWKYSFSHQAESTSTSKESWRNFLYRFQWRTLTMKRISERLFDLP